MTQPLTPFQLPPLPQRSPHAHKGTFGTVIILGGAPHMIGAPALAASAALRTGAGLVKLATPESILPHCLTIEPCATGIPLSFTNDHATQDAINILLNAINKNTVIAAGPGFDLGQPQQQQQQQQLIVALLQQSQPVILDADALNNLTHIKPLPFPPKCPLILTPHPGEYKRLAKLFNLNFDPTDPQQRPQAAAALAQATHSTVVLKGNNTIVTDGKSLYTNTTGNPALATAGTGDILTGIIASLLAQSLAPLPAAALATYLHGLAADLYADVQGHTGLKATDLPGLIPNAMQIYAQA